MGSPAAKHFEKVTKQQEKKASKKASVKGKKQATPSSDVTTEEKNTSEEKRQDSPAKRHFVQAQAKAESLEPLQEQLEKYGEVVQGLLETRTKELDAKKAVDALPESMSSAEKLNWLNENESLFHNAGHGTPRRPDDKKPTEEGKVSSLPIRL